MAKPAYSNSEVVGVFADVDGEVCSKKVTGCIFVTVIQSFSTEITTFTEDSRCCSCKCNSKNVSDCT